MRSVKISIVTISYNSEKTIEETIKSIVNQSYRNIEYLIIDGGSTDNTLNIIEKYKEKISFVISERDNGISDAFNKGISYATGDLIGIINSDDILLPGALSTLALSYDPEIDVYRGNTIIWNDKTGLKKRERPSMKFPLVHFLLRVSHQSTFITKAAYSKFGVYNTTFRFIMDVDLLTRFYYKKSTFKYVDYDLAMYRMGGITNTSLKEKKNEIELYINNNGGTKFHFLFFYYTHLLIANIKKVLILIDEDLSRKLRFENI